MSIDSSGVHASRESSIGVYPHRIIGGHCHHCHPGRPPSACRAPRQQKAHSIRCLNNHRQLTYGWILYADDNEYITAASDPRDAGGPEPIKPAWVRGLMDFDPATAPTGIRNGISTEVPCGSMSNQRRFSSVPQTKVSYRWVIRPCPGCDRWP